MCVRACLGEYKKNGQPLTLVVVDTLRAVPLVVSGLGVEGAVDRQLQVVAAQPVSVRVRVRVQATLKQVVVLSKPCQLTFGAGCVNLYLVWVV